ncbi:glutathione S-transferase family protein [Trinickia mobilis]|uniref:glutathione S-transferase family protein n=1 Tax=Trinickia mobilis TaxID=2816356 RepID=UPI001A8FCD08|nr:glutathione S-transferase family protein [Trinickia mobilis]
MRSNPIDLYGARTGNCLRVAIALEEAGLPYRPIGLNLQQGEQQEAKFLALNPAGKVPVIVDRTDNDEALVLTQSNAILLYVAEAVPGTLFPVGGARQRAIVYERFCYFLTDVIAVSHAAFHLRSDGQKGASPQALDLRAIKALSAAERFVKTSTFVAGETFTLADIAAVTIAFALERHIDWSMLPQLHRWYRAVMARPAVLRGLAAFGARQG